MRHLRLLPTLLVFLLLPGRLPAQWGAHLYVAPSGERRVQVEPPQFMTCAFVASNALPESRELVEELGLPEGWQGMALDSSFAIGPSTHVVRVVGFSIPAGTSRGHYPVTYTVRERTDSTRGATTTMEVRIPDTHRLELTVRETPPRVLAGSEYAAHFTVTNRSNRPQRIRLGARCTGGDPVELDQTEWRAAPGETLPLTAVVQTTKHLTKVQSQRVLVTAEIVRPWAPPVIATAVAPVEVIPRESVLGDLYRRVPSRIITRYLNQAGRQDVQVEVSGAGAVDPRGQWRLGYQLRGPHDLEHHTYGLRDEYTLSLEHRLGELRAGDMTFELSPLLGQSRLGRGVKAGLSAGSFSAGGFSFRARQKYPDLQETGSYAAFSAGPRFMVRANLLAREDRNGRHRLAGIMFNAVPQRGLQLEGELGTDLDNTGWNDESTAARLRLTATQRAVRLTAEAIHAGRSFSGRYRDYDQASASTALALARGLQATAGGRWMRQRFGGMASLTRWPASEEQWQAGLSYTVSVRTQLSLDVEQFHRDNRLPWSAYDGTERTGTLRVRRSIGKFSTGGSVRRGEYADQRAGRNYPVEHYSVNAGWDPSPRQRYSVSYQTGYSGFAAVNRRARILGFNASYRVIRRLNLQASFQTQRTGFIYQRSMDQFLLDARLTVFRDHVLALRLRRLARDLEPLDDGTSLLVSYEIPVGVPVGRQPGSGSVKGRIYDAEDMAQRGLSGMVVRLDGLAAVTDRRGNFCFSGVRHGEHYLQLDRATTGLSRVATVKTPLALRVQDGRTSELEIGVARSATLEGEIAVFGLPQDASRRGLLVGTTAGNTPDSAMERISGLAHASLLLQSPSELLEIAADAEGRFRVPELRPGRWSIRVQPSDLPAHHSPEEEVYSLRVEPGQDATLAIRVMPRQRSLMIVDEGKVPIVTSSRR